MGAPRSGDTITYTRLDGTTCTARAVRVEGNLCWTDYGDGEITPFIWRFHDGLNTMHDWPGKATQPPAPPLHQGPGVHASPP